MDIENAKKLPYILISHVVTISSFGLESIDVIRPHILVHNFVLSGFLKRLAMHSILNFSVAASTEVLKCYYSKAPRLRKSFHESNLV